MSNKNKFRRYSKAELEIVRANADVTVVGELVSRLLNGARMSVSETEFACSVLRASKPEGSIEFVNLASIPAAQDYIFKNLYIHYFADLEGRYGIDKFTGLVSIQEKREDVNKLNDYFISWEKVVSTNRHNENLLNLVINEINPDLKHVRELYDKGAISKQEYDYKRKSIVLHSKYLYLNAKAFFDEHGSDTVTVIFHGNEIEINEYSLVHILNRHYAGAAKQFDTGKSFHFDRGLKWYEIPYELKRIIEKIGTIPQTQLVEINFIPFKYQGITYAIWTEKKKKHVKGKVINYIRLETFYPIEEQRDFDRIKNNCREVSIDSSIVGYAEK